MQISTQSIERTIAFTREYELIGKDEPAWLSLADIVPDVDVTGNLTISFSCETIEVFADPLLGKVFLNMMDNTLRHAEGATSVSISCSPTEAGGLTIAWEDNGPGVPNALKKTIFERGFGINTGLGLFFVLEILSITNITIRECGIEGEGARFELVVPAEGWRVKGDTVDTPENQSFL